MGEEKYNNNNYNNNNNNESNNKNNNHKNENPPLTLYFKMKYLGLVTHISGLMDFFIN